jgi:hypothetical protein
MLSFVAGQARLATGEKVSQVGWCGPLGHSFRPAKKLRKKGTQKVLGGSLQVTVTSQETGQMGNVG